MALMRTGCGSLWLLASSIIAIQAYSALADTRMVRIVENRMAIGKDPMWDLADGQLGALRCRCPLLAPLYEDRILFSRFRPSDPRVRPARRPPRGCTASNRCLGSPDRA